ncbi:calcium/calmodulin-dependent protein kinase type 1 [Aphelenchoides avenae]|nr:calcium/calmodulin-dependent protein kinase type 1 [Aphelenchus avenae]
MGNFVPSKLKVGPDVNMKQKVEPTAFTVGRIASLMHGSDARWDKLVAEHSLAKVDVQQIAIGYMSFVARISFHFDGEKEPFPVVLKVPTADKITQLNSATNEEYVDAFAGTLVDWHDKEIYIYAQLADSQQHFALPKVYAWQKCSEEKRTRSGLNGTFMLMKDLGVRGAMPDMLTGLTKGQVESVIRAIAGFHSFSLTLQNGEELFETIRPSHEMDKEVRFVYHTPPVLCHSDLWANNIFFEKNADETASEQVYALVDWQLAHPGTGLIDFCRLVFNSVNAALKDRHIDEWLRLYFDSFATSCDKLGVKCPYTWDLVQRMFRHQAPSELLFSFMLLSIYYQKVPVEELRKEFVARMVSNFELIKRALGNPDNAFTMMTTSSSYTKSQDCPVCLEMYRDPRTLPSCGHSVCSACVQQLIANTTSPGNVVCPECRVHSRVPTNGFPRNYRLADLIATLEAAGYRETSQCSGCRSQVPNRRLRECVTCAPEVSLLICADCALHRHEGHRLAQFRGPPAPAPSNPSAQAVAPNPVTVDETTPLPEDCCGRFKAVMQAVCRCILILNCIVVAALIVFILVSLAGPMYVLKVLTFGLVFCGICACCLCRND